MKCIAIIPARGGSKRIPKKNVKEFLGIPIIAYSIRAAVQSEIFDEVMVSTDDHEIANIAEKFGAKVPFFRSSKNSDDYATTSDVLVEVLGMYEQKGMTFDYACCIYATAPLLKFSKIRRGFDVLIKDSFQTVFPVVANGYPIWRSLFVTNSRATMVWPEHLNSRSQDLPKTWHDAGQFYWLEVKSFLQEKKLFGLKSGVIELTELEVQDIDSPEDWKLAELKAQLQHEQG